MCTIAIEALTPLNRTSRIKLYRNIVRSRLFSRIGKRSIHSSGPCIQVCLQCFCSPRKPRDKFEGNLLQDILEQAAEGDTLDDTQVIESPIGQMTYPVERQLVDLVTGDEHHNISRILKRLDQNSDESISDAFSDVEDPVHEESLINDLFFTKKLVRPFSPFCC